jgi:hypothetical protein
MATYQEEKDQVQLWIREKETTVEEDIRGHQILVRDEELKPIIQEKQSEAISHFEQL